MGFLVVARIADLWTDHDWADNAHGIWPSNSSYDATHSRLPRHPHWTSSCPLGVAPCDHLYLWRPSSHSLRLCRLHLPGMFGHGRHYSYDNAFIKERKKKATLRTYLHSCGLRRPLIHRGNSRSSVLRSTSVIRSTIRISPPSESPTCLSCTHLPPSLLFLL